MVSVMLVTEPNKGIQGSHVSPRGSLHQCGDDPVQLCFCQKPSLWMSCVHASLCIHVTGICRVEVGDKHKLPLVTAPSWMQLDIDPGRWSCCGALNCKPTVQKAVVRQSSAHIWALLFMGTKLEQIIEYLPAPISSPRSWNNNTHHPLSDLQWDIEAIECTGSRSWWPSPTGTGTKTFITDPWFFPYLSAELRLGREVVKEHPGWKHLQLSPLWVEALWLLLSLTLWPVQGVAMEGDPTHVQGLSLHIPACKQPESFHSLIMSPGHSRACSPQGRMPVVIHARWWPSWGDRCLLHTLCQWGPAVLP